MSIENQHSNCADITEDGFIRIPLTLPAPPYLENGRLFLQFIECDEPLNNQLHQMWHAQIKGRYPTNEDFVFPAKTKLQK